ncbi:MAG: hypothetical protein NVS1B4_05730 [Gemmatimonadaceae bacterium]
MKTVVAIVVIGSVLSAVRGLDAQSPARCIVDIEGSQGRQETRTNLVQLPTGKYNAFIGGGFVGRCRGQDVTLRSDSAEFYGDRSLVYLIGHVHYVEPRVAVDSHHATYHTIDEHLVAEGNVIARLPTGSTLHGPSAEYFRPVPGVRPRARMIAVGRPQIDLVQVDSAGRTQEPVHVIADVVTMDGDSLVYAAGRVEITRPDIVARGDSAFLDGSHEFARLMRSPSIDGRSTRPFQLRGETIDVFSKQKQLQRVLSVVHAHAVSQDLDLRADTIDLRASGNRLSHAFAWGQSRARAVSPTQTLVADSLDVDMPGQQVREVRAVRRAYAEGVPDTTKFRSTERDWLRGDTIIALFDTAATADSARQPTIRELLATGSAKSLYQIAPAKGRSVPSLNYVRGRQITVSFLRGQVTNVAVRDRASGVYLEALSDSALVAQQRRAGKASGTPARPSSTPAQRRP